MDLGGTWQAAPGDDALRRRFVAPTFDDGAWSDLAVPGHWRSAPGFEASDGPVLYRRSFGAPRPADGRRTFLVLEGCFYQADVWLDGSYLGDTEGYFFPHAFEVTNKLRARSQHVLAVELTCTPPLDRATKRYLSGAFQHSDSLDPDWNPGGIWRPVNLVETGAVRIAALRVRCPAAAEELARLDVTATFDALTAGPVELRTTVEPGGVEQRHTVHLSPGPNEVSWLVEIADPPLWWPKALSPAGARPTMVEVVVEARPVGPDGSDGSAEGGGEPPSAPSAGPGQPSDVARRFTGLRQVRMSRFVLEVNGERLFLKGADLGPTRMALGEASAAEIEADVALAQDAGLDLLRVHAHISRPELYDAADRAGLLLWQDLPLQRRYTRTIRPQAVSQARAAVDLLAHHPSVAIWCAHNEPVAIDTRLPPARALLRYAAGQVLPGWNKSILDSAVAQTLEAADASRPVVPHSGVLPHPAWGTDTHDWLGWYRGDERSLPAWLRRLPALGRFVGEFGAQAVPDTAAWMEPQRWPDLDWERLGRNHGLQKAAFDRRVPPAAFPSFDSWRTATQEHQATVIRHHVEELRRRKYRPTGGFCLLSLVDGHPAVSWAVLDYERAPKLGLAALRAACAPVIVTADRPAATYTAGTAVALDVHVVSDLRHPLSACRLDASLAWPGGGHRWAFSGDVPPDAVARVGTLSFVVPEARGPLVLDLRLDGPATASATYRSEIVTAPASSSLG